MNNSDNNKVLSRDAYQDGDFVIDGNVKYPKAKLVDFHGRKYAVNPNAILTINCTAKCNCNCSFCYNKKTFIFDDEYVSSEAFEIGRVIDFARLSNIGVVTLSGGEPTLDAKKMLALVSRFKAAGFRTLRLHTNGISLCKTIVIKNESNPLWWWLKSFGLNDLSLSVADYREDRNRRIMGHDSISALKGFLPYISGCGMRVRLSCVISQDGVYTINDIKNYIDFACLNAILHVIFRIEPSLMSNNPSYLDSLVSKLCDWGYHIEYSHIKTDSIVYSLSGNLHIDISCVKEELDKDKKIRRLIYMPNRIVYTSWIDPCSILFEDDADKMIK